MPTAGRAELGSWFATPLECRSRPRDELAIKLAMALTTPGVDVRGVIQVQRSATLRTLRDLTRPEGTGRSGRRCRLAARQRVDDLPGREGGAAAAQRRLDTPSSDLALIAGLVTLLGGAISVALSAAEGRADRATLAAVGAPPRRRRELVAMQALLVGGLGGVPRVE